MKLKQLLQGIEDIEVRGSKEVLITGISADSRLVAPKNLFIAKKDARHIAQAVDAGAVAVVTDLYDPFLKLPQILCKDLIKIESILAARYYGYPSEELFVVGITGSKGKTTTSYLVRHLLEKSDEPCGLLGTVETIVREERSPARLTTHDVIFNQKILREMVIKQCKAVVLEVSSHGLDQGRVESISFDVAIFTQLHPDHLDYHKTVEAYAMAKQKLFTSLQGTAILNADCKWSSFMQGGSRQIYVSIEKPSDLQATQITFTDEGLEFFVNGVRFFSKLMGRFNVYNMLSAIALGVERGISLVKIRDILADFPGVPGRLERVENGRGIHIFVDYAHTGEALENVLKTLKEIAKGRLILVFGCGGNRDHGRRKAMGKAALQYADLTIVTSDNPRSEDPEEIVRDILQAHPNAMVDLDRKGAIFKAIEMAKPGDIVLIAGKGHEKVQIFANKTLPFDDVAIAKEGLQK